MANFGTAVFTAVLATAPLVSGAAAAGGALGAFGATAARVGAGLTTAVAVPMAALGVGMVAQSLKIEQAWDEVRATYNATPHEIERLVAPHGKLGQAVTDLSLKYGLARVEVIELLAKLSQMGYTGKEATDTLRQGLEFAVAAGLKLEDGLNLSVAIVNTFGLKGAQLTETLRGLNVVENNTAASGFDLMKALTRAGGAAESMVGPTFTSKDAVASLAAGMAVLKANGQETARSADALRAIFQRMYTPTNQVQEMLDKMGVSLHTAKGEIVPFPELLQNLADNFHKLTPYERMQFGKKLIGVEFGPLFQTLIKDVQQADKGMSIYNNTLNEFGDTAKGAEAYARELEIRQHSLKVALGQVKAAFGLLVDVLRPAISSVLKPIAGAIAALAKGLSNASPFVQKFAVVMILVLAVVPPLVLIIGALVAAFAAIGGPIIAVVVAIGAIVGAFIAVIQAGGPLADFVKGVLGAAWENIKAGLSSLQGAFKNLMPWFKVLGAVFGGALLAGIYVLSGAFRVLAAVLEFIAGIVGWFFNLIVKVATWAYDVLVGHSIIPDLINAIIFWFQFLWDILGPMIEAIWNVVVIAFQTGAEIVKNVISAMVAVVTAIWNILWTVIQSAVNIIVTVVREGFNILMTVVTLVWTTIVTIVQTALQVLISIVTLLINQIVTTMQFAWDVIKAAVTLVWNVIKTIVETALGVIKGIINTVMGVLTGDWSRAWEGIKQIATSVWNGIKGLWSAFWDFLKSVSSAALNFIKSTFSNVWNAIKSIVSSVWNAIKSLWNSFWSSMKSIGQSALNIIKSVITGAINTVKSIISNGINAAKAVWSAAWNSFKSIVSGVVNSIKAIINGIIGTVRNVVNKVSGALGKIKDLGSKVKGMLGFSQGGLVPGRGTGDSVPAMLTPGEFVITKKAVRRIGAANLTRLNRNSGGSAVLGLEGNKEISSGPGLSPTELMKTAASTALNNQRLRRRDMLARLRYDASRANAGDAVADNRQTNITFQTAVYNPVAEKASDSVQRRVTRLAEMGMFAGSSKE